MRFVKDFFFIELNKGKPYAKTNLQKMDSQLRLKSMFHLNKGMIRLMAKEFNSYNITIKTKQIEKLVLVNFLSNMDTK